MDDLPMGTDERQIAKPVSEGEKKLLAAMEGVCARVDSLTSALLAQGQEIARLNRALSTVRVSRTQEIALQEAIRTRAKELTRLEGMPQGCEKRIGAAIRTTLREILGARAAGDVQACQFDQAMRLAQEWRMPGVLRRIRKAAEEKEA